MKKNVGAWCYAMRIKLVLFAALVVATANLPAMARGYGHFRCEVHRKVICDNKQCTTKSPAGESIIVDYELDVYRLCTSGKGCDSFQMTWRNAGIYYIQSVESSVLMKVQWMPSVFPKGNGEFVEIRHVGTAAIISHGVCR